MRVLIIDDDPPFMLVIHELVTLIPNVETQCVKSGEDALTILDGSSRAFDLIVTDLSLPGISGWTFLKELQQIPDHSLTPVIVVSGYVDPPMELAARRAGFA